MSTLSPIYLTNATFPYAYPCVHATNPLTSPQTPHSTHAQQKKTWKTTNSLYYPHRCNNKNYMRKYQNPKVQSYNKMPHVSYFVRPCLAVACNFKIVVIFIRQSVVKISSLVGKGGYCRFESVMACNHFLHSIQ